MISIESYTWGYFVKYKLTGDSYTMIQNDYGTLVEASLLSLCNYFFSDLE